MGTTRLDIEYDGSAFAGWARQPGLRTVQGELDAALERILREPTPLTVAGRTDAGVHAWAQVASFESPVEVPTDLARRINGISGHDLSVLAAAPAADGFDARRDARSRTYCYRVLARPVPSPFEQRRALWWPGRLDPTALGDCAAALVGSHDFTAFTPTDSDHVRFEREIYRAEWVWEPSTTRPRPTARAEDAGGILCFWVKADTFMRHMVRILVGTMLEVAEGSRDPAAFGGLLEGAPRTAAGETAPPHGLYLAGVGYGDGASPSLA